jgi:hypothetical protein
MATLEDNLKASGLELYDLPDWERRLPIHQLWISAEFWDWFDDTKELHDERYRVAKRTLADQIEQLFCDFRCSIRPGAGDLKRAMPTRKGIWKIHPPKLRLYGWAPKIECLAVICGALELDTKDKTQGSINEKKRDEVLAFIKKNGLPMKLGDILAIFPPPKN